MFYGLDYGKEYITISDNYDDKTRSRKNTARKIQVTRIL